MKLFVFSLFYICKKVIRFFHKNFLTLDQNLLVEWLIEIAKKEGQVIKKLEYNFVKALTLGELNKKFLNHDTETDILTFDYSKDNQITAEAFVSCEALKENAKEFKQSIENETLRLISHALLHCAGYTDKDEDEKSLMRIKEDEYIEMFHVKQ